MAKHSRGVSVLRITFLGTVFCASACKLGQPQSALRDGEADQTAGQVSVHGELVPLAAQNEILLALGETPTTPTTDPSKSDPLNPQRETQIAQPETDPSLPDVDTSAYALQAGDAYIDRCRAAGVPIPPPWGDAGWKVKKQLTSGRIFALNPNLTTTLYSFQDPKVKGTCAALPRMKRGTIMALGIICQSATGNACFWDNKERAVVGGRQATISDPRSIRPELIANADNLLENCSGCHRGTNVFILHNEELQTLPDSDSTDTYVPVSEQGSWSNPLLDEASVPQCAECHDSSKKLGRLDATYCSTVMMPSIQSKRWTQDRATGKWVQVDLHAGAKPPMPPEDQVMDVKAFATDTAFIKGECKKAFAAEGLTWVWDQTSPKP